MKKDTVRIALAVPLGVALVLLGRPWAGAAIVLFGLVMLAIDWHFRYVRPLDPALMTAIDQAMKLDKSDPVAAERLLDKALEEAAHKEELELADLRGRAATDRRAALELRGRLRGKLKNQQSARRKAEKAVGTTPNGSGLLREMDRQASLTQQQLSDVQFLLEHWSAS